MHSYLKFCAVTVSVIALCACTVGEDYERPELSTDSEWSALQEGNEQRIELAREAFLKQPWWQFFDDSTLNELVEKALANNNDLKIAAARIKEARANERIADSAFFPQIDATGSVNRGTMGGFLGNKPDTTRQGGVSGRWEIDVFGGNRRRSEAAEAATEAAQADERRTRLMLINEVARNYVRLRAVQQQQALTQRNLELQRGSLTITQAQRDENVVSQFDVLRARAQANSTKARLPQLKADAFAAIQRLTVLVADRPARMKAMLAEPKAIPSMPLKVVGATPIAALSYRPDIQAAERRLAQATALTGAAFAEFFPKLSLEGFFGASSSGMYGGMSPWSATANALFPIFNFGRIRAGVDAADARQEQALYNFQQTVLLAVEEIEVSYSAYLNEQERKQTLRQLASEQNEAAMIAREQYVAGIGQQLDLLDAQRNALDAETQFVLSQALATQNLIQLYTSFGDMESQPLWDKNTPEQPKISSSTEPTAKPKIATMLCNRAGKRVAGAFCN